MIDAIPQDVSLTVASAAEKILAMDEPPQEELSEDESETIEAPETEEVEDSSEEESEETSEESASLSELVEYLAENKDIYDDVKIPTKVNGKEGVATLSELVRAYQIGQSNDQKADSLASERQAFEAQKQDALSQTNQQLEQAKGLSQMLEQKFLEEFNQINWQELRETDPAEFSAKRQDFTERHGQLQQARQHITTTQQSQMRDAYREHLAKESKRLPELVPEWADETTAKQEKVELRNYLLSMNIPAEQIDGKVDANGNIVAPGLSDAHAIAIARKAMLYDRSQQNVSVTKKKVKKLPKVLKSGKTTTKSEIDHAAQKKKRDRLRQTGRPEDAASLIFDKLFGGQ